MLRNADLRDQLALGQQKSIKFTLATVGKRIWHRLMSEITWKSAPNMIKKDEGEGEAIPVRRGTLSENKYLNESP
ncbi:hypothetical protein CEXT_35581 [Caerostris extrusa]|uniref:Uncharacterized protein n=1 Tax=Caerostris extrusa TaxID=172846 RepID=A0AAV4X4M9_CAEEX|nr:hypothetical protein CEXT_35581 [Caerostris extrusa]